jgi:predicted HD superfamily hydrolase involved in NAD metabolism
VTLAAIEPRLRDAVDALPRGLRDHILRVETEAKRLAAIHDVDPGRARIAALGHDLVRHKKPTELLELATAYAIVPNDVERLTPILVHGPIAARILARDYAFEDAEIAAAIDCHTTARPGMSRLEQVLFVADKIEPQKLAANPKWTAVRDLAATSLDEAILRFLDLELEIARDRGWLLHPRFTQARNELLIKLRYTNLID